MTRSYRKLLLFVSFTQMYCSHVMSCHGIMSDRYRQDVIDMPYTCRNVGMLDEDGGGWLCDHAVDAKTLKWSLNMMQVLVMTLLISASV